MSPDQVTAYEVAVLWSAACWIAGASFSLWRSFGWRERIRRWADAVVSANENKSSQSVDVRESE